MSSAVVSTTSKSRRRRGVRTEAAAALHWFEHLEERFGTVGDRYTTEIETLLREVFTRQIFGTSDEIGDAKALRQTNAGLALFDSGRCVGFMMGFRRGLRAPRAGRRPATKRSLATKRSRTS